MCSIETIPLPTYSCVYMYSHVYTYSCVYIHVLALPCLFVCLCLLLSFFLLSSLIKTCTCTVMYIYTCTYSCVYIHVHVYTSSSNEHTIQCRIFLTCQCLLLSEAPPHPHSRPGAWEAAAGAGPGGRARRGSPGTAGEHRLRGTAGAVAGVVVVVVVVVVVAALGGPPGDFASHSHPPEGTHRLAGHSSSVVCGVWCVCVCVCM